MESSVVPVLPVHNSPDIPLGYGVGAMRSGVLTAAVFVVASACACSQAETQAPASVTRSDAIPADAVKMTPDTDRYPPVLRSDEFEDPIPMPGAINTAGAEDSPFISPDGNTFYLYFTPDLSLAPEQQLVDGVTGIYVSQRAGETWTEPERVWLQDPGKDALDGAETIVGETMYFASAREGYTGINWFTAESRDGAWTDWSSADDLNALAVGELHIVGDELFFHSDRPGGAGGLDIWVATRDGEGWGQPVNLSAINTAGDESRPFVTEDGTELWLTRTYNGTPSVWRSRRVASEWQEPELIVETFAGEASLDRAGDLYFVHHYLRDGVIIESDIYVCYRR
jgi:hypothetical protein